MAISRCDITMLNSCYDHRKTVRFRLAKQHNNIKMWFPVNQDERIYWCTMTSGPNASNWNYYYCSCIGYNKWTIYCLCLFKQMLEWWMAQRLNAGIRCEVKNEAIQLKKKVQIFFSFYITCVLSFCVIRLHLFLLSGEKGVCKMLSEVFYVPLFEIWSESQLFSVRYIFFYLEFDFWSNNTENRCKEQNLNLMTL